MSERPTLPPSYAPMTADEREEQAMSFAYGNLACSTNHRPVRSAFEEMVRNRGKWTPERFKQWADQLEWRA